MGFAWLSVSGNGFLTSSLRGRIGVQTAMEEMERLEQKGTATPEELEALAQEVSSKMLLTTWKATRWEVTNVRVPITSLFELSC